MKINNDIAVAISQLVSDVMPSNTTLFDLVGKTIKIILKERTGEEYYTKIESIKLDSSSVKLNITRIETFGINSLYFGSGYKHWVLMTESKGGEDGTSRQREDTVESLFLHDKIVV